MATKLKGYMNNPRIRPLGETISLTKEQMKEYIKCANKPEYFIENYVKIVTIDECLVPIKLWKFQKEMVQTIHENNRVVINAARQIGKCLDINTLIKLRNKSTGDIIEMTIGEFYELQKAIQSKTNK